MQTILDRFDKKTPHYPDRYRDLIDRLSRKRAFDTAKGTEEEKFAQDKTVDSHHTYFLLAVYAA